MEGLPLVVLKHFVLLDFTRHTTNRLTVFPGCIQPSLLLLVIYRRDLAGHTLILNHLHDKNMSKLPSDISAPSNKMPSMTGLNTQENSLFTFYHD